MPLEPPLPVELWEAILREAAIGFHASHPWIIPSATPLQRKRWRASMLVKRQIVLVCKQWYSLGMPLLHEHIILKRWKSTGDFAANASRTSSIDNTLGSFGRFTRRLDVACMNERIVSCDPLVILLRELPNLLIFTVQTGRFPVTADLLASLAPTLECLELREDSVPIWEHALQLPFDSLPNLQMASIPSRSEVQGAKPLSALKQFCIPIEAKCPISLGFPSLKALGTLQIWASSEADKVSFRSMIDSWGGKITCLFLNLTFSNITEHLVQCALEHCPVLEELFITTPYASEWLLPKVTNSKVKLLGVRFNDELRTTVCHDLFALLRDAKSKLSELKVIMFFDERNVIHLRKSHAARCRRVVDEIKAQGQISLEDHLGRELVF